MDYSWKKFYEASFIRRAASIAHTRYPAGCKYSPHPFRPITVSYYIVSREIALAEDFCIS
jgi:hypothetical protein